MPLPCVQRRTRDDGQRYCLKYAEFYSKIKFEKYAEFYSKIKFEKLAHLVGLIIRIYHDAWSPGSQIPVLELHGDRT